MARQKTQDEWKKNIKDCDDNKLSIPAWCKENKIRLVAMRYWIKRQSKVQNQTETQWIPFVGDVVKSEIQTNAEITVKIGAYSVEVHEGFNQYPKFHEHHQTMFHMFSQKKNCYVWTLHTPITDFHRQINPCVAHINKSQFHYLKIRAYSC